MTLRTLVPIVAITSGLAAKETILKVYLIPLLGAKRLDAITNEEIQRMKGHLKGKAPKTVNNS